MGSLMAEDSSQTQWAGVVLRILCVLAVVSGVLAVILRFTERPRETLVRSYSADDFNIPVIHARKK